MRYAYKALLWLYPNSYRGAFGREMATVFERAAGDYRPRGLPAYCAFLCSEFAGLIAGAFSMWTDEYLLRSRRRPTAPFMISLLAGAAISAFFQGFFLMQIGHPGRHDIARAQVPDPRQVVPDRLAIMLLAGGALIFISLFSMSFVWNMRVIGTRAGRLKPIWMPGRNCVGPRRELRRRGRTARANLPP